MRKRVLFAASMIAGVALGRGTNDGSSIDNAHEATLLEGADHGYTLKLYTYNTQSGGYNQLHGELEMTHNAQSIGVEYKEFGFCIEMANGWQDCMQVQTNLNPQNQSSDPSWSSSFTIRDKWFQGTHIISDPYDHAEHPGVNWVSDAATSSKTCNFLANRADLNLVQCSSVNAHFYRYFATSDTQYDIQLSTADAGRDFKVSGFTNHYSDNTFTDSVGIPAQGTQQNIKLVSQTFVNLINPATNNTSNNTNNTTNSTTNNTSNNTSNPTSTNNNTQTNTTNSNNTSNTSNTTSNSSNNTATNTSNNTTSNTTSNTSNNTSSNTSNNTTSNTTNNSSNTTSNSNSNTTSNTSSNTANNTANNSVNNNSTSNNNSSSTSNNSSNSSSSNNTSNNSNSSNGNNSSNNTSSNSPNNSFSNSSSNATNNTTNNNSSNTSNNFSSNNNNSSSTSSSSTVQNFSQPSPQDNHGCYDLSTTTTVTTQNYEQCNNVITGLKSDINGLIAANKAAEICEATKIQQYLALPNTLGWKYDGEAIQSEADKNLNSRTQAAKLDQRAANGPITSISNQLQAATRNYFGQLGTQTTLQCKYDALFEFQNLMTQYDGDTSQVQTYLNNQDDTQVAKLQNDMQTALTQWTNLKLLEDSRFEEQQTAEVAFSYPITTDSVSSLQTNLDTATAAYNQVTNSIATFSQRFLDAETAYKEVCKISEMKILLGQEIAAEQDYQVSLARIRAAANTVQYSPDPNLNTAIQLAISSWEESCSSTTASDDQKKVADQTLAQRIKQYDPEQIVYIYNYMIANVDQDKYTQCQNQFQRAVQTYLIDEPRAAAALAFEQSCQLKQSSMTDAEDKYTRTLEFYTAQKADYEAAFKIYEPYSKGQTDARSRFSQEFIHSTRDEEKLWNILYLSKPNPVLVSAPSSPSLQTIISLEKAVESAQKAHWYSQLDYYSCSNEAQLTQVKNEITSGLTKNIEAINTVCNPVLDLIKDYQASIQRVDQQVADVQARKTRIINEQHNRIGCASSVFNTVIDKGNQADITLLNSQLQELYEQKADLNRWLGVQSVHWADSCVDENGHTTADYQDQIDLYQRFGYQSYPVQDQWQRLGQFTWQTTIQAPCAASPDQLDQYKQDLDPSSPISRQKFSACFGVILPQDNYGCRIDCVVLNSVIPGAAVDDSGLKKTELSSAINDYYQKRKAWDDLNQQLQAQTTEMKLLWAKAEEIIACTANVASNNEQILQKETQIVNTEGSCFSNNRKSYWNSLKTQLSIEKLSAPTSAFTIPTSSAYFQTQSSTQAASSTRRRLAAKQEVRNDRDIIQEIDSVVSPSKLYMCQLHDILSGMQVWYGYYNAIVGKQHGDLSISDDCKEIYLRNKRIMEIDFYIIGTYPASQVVGIQIQLQDYTDGKVENIVHSMGQTGTTMPFSGTTITKETILLTSGLDFWGFQTDQAWAERAVLSTIYNGQSPGVRTMREIKIVTYNKSAVEAQQRKFVAYNTLGSNSVQYYNNGILAAQKGIDYWTNYENYVAPMLASRAAVYAPQAVPLSLSQINGVIRPQDADEKKNRIGAYVRLMRNQQEPNDDQLLSLGFDKLTNRQIAYLVHGIDYHMNEEIEDDYFNYAKYGSWGIGGMTFLIFSICCCIKPQKIDEEPDMDSKDNFEIEVHPIKPVPKVEKKSSRGQLDFYVGPEEPYIEEPATNNSLEIIPKQTEMIPTNSYKPDFDKQSKSTYNQEFVSSNASSFYNPHSRNHGHMDISDNLYEDSVEDII